MPLRYRDLDPVTRRRAIAELDAGVLAYPRSEVEERATAPLGRPSSGPSVRLV